MLLGSMGPIYTGRPGLFFGSCAPGNSFDAEPRPPAVRHTLLRWCRLHIAHGEGWTPSANEHGGHELDQDDSRGAFSTMPWFARSQEEV